MRLFLSYAVDDLERAAPLVAALRQMGYRLLDMPFTGDDPRAELEARIIDCVIFVALLTPDALNDRWSQWAFKTAIEQGKPVIALQPEDAGRGDLADYISFAELLRVEDAPDFAEPPDSASLMFASSAYHEFYSDEARTGLEEQHPDPLYMFDPDAPIQLEELDAGNWEGGTPEPAPVTVLAPAPITPVPVSAPPISPQPRPSPEATAYATGEVPVTRPKDVIRLEIPRPVFLGGSLAALILVGLLAMVAFRPAIEAAMNITPSATFTPSVSPTVTLTPSATYTPSITPTPSDTPTVTPTPTATLVNAFPFGAQGVILADAGGALAESLTSQNVSFLRLQRPVADAAEARRQGERYNAALVIWGSDADLLNIEMLAKTPTDSFEAVTHDLHVFQVANNEFAPLLIRGLVFYANADYIRAEGTFETLAETLPEDASFAGSEVVYLYLGSVYDKTRQFDAAVQAFNQAATTAPDQPLAVFNRGIARYHRGEFDAAVQDLAAALSLRYEEPSVYYNRGNAYYNLGDFTRAIADYNTAVTLNPSFSAAYNSRGTAYARQGQYEQALADFNRAIEINRDFAQAYSNRGLLYRNLAQFDKAIADYDRAILLNPNAAESYFTRGVIYANLKEYDTAIVNFDRAAVLTPNNPEIYYMRGIARSFLKDYAAAETDFKTALRVNPQYADAYAALGTIYQAQGLSEAAITAYQQHINMAGDKALEFAVTSLQALESTPQP
jgi:tetratricopeptide (TPR) repeat protein